MCRGLKTREREPTRGVCGGGGGGEGGMWKVGEGEEGRVFKYRASGQVSALDLCACLPNEGGGRMMSRVARHGPGMAVASDQAHLGNLESRPSRYSPPRLPRTYRICHRCSRCALAASLRFPVTSSADPSLRGRAFPGPARTMRSLSGRYIACQFVCKSTPVHISDLAIHDTT